MVAAGVATLLGCGTMGSGGVPNEAPALVGRTSSGPPALGCEAHPRIDRWAERMGGRGGLRRSTAEILARGTPFVPKLMAILEREGLPSTLAFLPAIESGFQPDARSGHGDVGLWQLRSPTARRFGLVVGKRRDDRLHPERSTQAAARYLLFLHRRYGDWPLALAAYNAGEGRVDRARARQPDATFWELAERGHLPAVSRDYVPRFLAVVRLSGVGGPCPAMPPPALQTAAARTRPS